MAKNLSCIDRIVHIVLGILLIIVPLTMMKNELISTIIILMGIIVLFMGVLGWSGIYSILGISTVKSSHSKISGKDIKKAVEGHLSGVQEARSSTTKKTTTKKVTAKKAAAKKTPTKASKTKSTTKQAPVKKTVAKKKSAKVSANKTTTKKASIKKTAAKKTSAKKTK